MAILTINDLSKGPLSVYVLLKVSFLVEYFLGVSIYRNRFEAIFSESFQWIFYQ